MASLPQTLFRLVSRPLPNGQNSSHHESIFSMTLFSRVSKTRAHICRRLVHPGALPFDNSQVNAVEVSGAHPLVFEPCGLVARLSTTAAKHIPQIISASEYWFCTSSVRTYSCALDPRMITSRRTQKT